MFFIYFIYLFVETGVRRLLVRSMSQDPESKVAVKTIQ
jgi:hypothetical protein